MSDALSQILYQLEAEILDPAVRRSRDAVSRLLADEFFEIGSSGSTYDKAAILDFLEAEHRGGVADRQAIGDFSARLLGKGLALTLYRIVRTRPDGAVSHSLRSSIWTMADGRWRMLFHQGTPTQPKAEAAMRS